MSCLCFPGPVYDLLFDIAASVQHLPTTWICPCLGHQLCFLCFVRWVFSTYWYIVLCYIPYYVQYTDSRRNQDDSTCSIPIPLKNVFYVWLKLLSSAVILTVSFYPHFRELNLFCIIMSNPLLFICCYKLSLFGSWSGSGLSLSDGWDNERFKQ